MRTLFTARALFTAVVLLVSSCSSASDNAATSRPGLTGDRVASANVTKGCIENYEEGFDYFPEKAVVEYAKKFSVEYHKSYKVVTIHEASEGGPLEQYVLLQCGAPEPAIAKGLPGPAIIRVPITSLFSASTTHFPLMIDLDRVDVLTGVASAARIAPRPVMERMKSAGFVEYSKSGILDVELVISRPPALLMASGTSNASYSVIRNAGVPVVANVEWLEPSALGRAEWIKYLALFLNEEARAERRFDTIRNNYLAFAKRTSRIPEKDRPRVTTGNSNRGTYYIDGGKSYAADLIQAAGGAYVWADIEDTGSAIIDMERQIERSADADFWINGRATSLAGMLAEEPRYVEFKAYRTGQVWLPFSDDYWSRSVTRPDLLLADLIKIFHPDLARDHEFEWYHRVPQNEK